MTACIFKFVGMITVTACRGLMDRAERTTQRSARVDGGGPGASRRQDAPDGACLFAWTWAGDSAEAAGGRVNHTVSPSSAIGQGAD